MLFLNVRASSLGKGIKNGDIEESILDFFVVCSKVLPYITRMVIDESKKFVLTNYRNVTKTGKAVECHRIFRFRY